MDEHKLNRFAVIGNPIAQSKSPKIHQSFAAQFGIELTYEKMHVEPANFNKVVKDFFATGGLGLNITTPYKAEAAKLADHCSSMANISESVNTLYLDQSSKELLGDSTDGIGWITDAKRHNINLEQSRVLVIGAGGAARVIINQLLTEPVAAIHVCNRTEARAQKLVADKVTASDLENVPDGNWDLIINSLSVGWQGNYPKIDIKVSPLCKAYDLNYGEGALAFKKWFIAAQGVEDLFYDGWGMLVEQAAESFHLWWKQKPDTAQLIKDGPV